MKKTHTFFICFCCPTIVCRKTTFFALTGTESFFDRQTDHGLETVVTYVVHAQLLPTLFMINFLSLLILFSLGMRWV